MPQPVPTASSAVPSTAPSEEPPAEETDDPLPWRAPLIWRVLLRLSVVLVPLVCRLRVTGDIPKRLRGGPLILAANHIGTFDPIAFTAACARIGVAPRILATGGLFRAPIVGTALRRCGHIRVDRHEASVTAAYDTTDDAIRQRSIVAGYPEGRISLDPALWPERGRTGLARLALATRTPVLAVAHWGAHEVMTWDCPGRMLRRLLTAFWRRPIVRVHFGQSVDLSDLALATRGDARRATDRIVDGIVAELTPLRAGEPRLPRYVDPIRPLSTARSRKTRQSPRVARR